MNRRAAMLALIACGAPFASRAQPAKEKVFVIGFLSSGPRPPKPAPGAKPGPFSSALTALGYTEGRNLRIESRYADGKLERLAALADELVRLPVDVIVVGTTDVAIVVKKATTSIPIVLMGAFAPEEAGLVKSLARPGGNITGVAFDAGVQVFGKRLEILKAALPGLRGVRFMGPWQPETPKPKFHGAV